MIHDHLYKINNLKQAVLPLLGHDIMRLQGNHIQSTYHCMGHLVTHTFQVYQYKYHMDKFLSNVLLTIVWVCTHCFTLTAFPDLDICRW